MKISVLSDMHFGYAYSYDLEDDSFTNAEEAIDKSLESDLIILCGDVFDIRAPKTPTWAKALKILSKPLLKENSGTKLVSCTKELKDISKRTLNHIPMVAIHGNHERLAKGQQNTVEALENAGILVHLHLNTTVFEKNGIKVAIHGMSSVPERYAKDVLDQWNPTPVKDCYNILVLHQSIDPYIYSPIEPPTLSTSNLPKGFDLIVNGHLHTHGMEQLRYTKLIMPGSTVITQFQKSESEIEKAFLQLTIGKDADIKFVPLETSRKFFYHEVQLNGIPVQDIAENKIRESLFSKEFGKKPVIRMKLTGKQTVNHKELTAIANKFSDKAIVIFAKELDSPEIAGSMELLKNLKEQKFSLEEIGLNLLKKNLDNLHFGSSFDYIDVFHLLSEGDIDNTFDLLVGAQKSLSQFGR